MTPKPYLSYSQMILVESSPRRYLDQYIHGIEKRSTRAMGYGSDFALTLETGEETGDIILDIMASKIPKFDLMDVPLQVDYKVMKKVIPILIKPDTAKADYSAFKEYKTGTKVWTQEDADTSGQITFYAMGMYILTKKIPQDIELIHLPTEKNEYGKPTLTGEMHRFPTKRTMMDISKMMCRASHAWYKIHTICETEIFS